jgi:uncharacterized protein YjbI with pentapeptide repeats
LLRGIFMAALRTPAIVKRTARMATISLGVVSTLLIVGWAFEVAPQRYAEALKPEELEALSETNRLEAEDRRLQSQNAVRATSLQAVGGVVVVLGVAATWLTVHINRQGQITERFTRAVDQLGNVTSTDVRLGGIHALERIARESENDRSAIVKVLAVFVRGHNPTVVDGWQEAVREESLYEPRKAWEPRAAVIDDPRSVRIRAPDVHEAAAVLARVNTPAKRVFLQNVYLANADLRSASLRYANLAGTNLQRANAFAADLRQTHLEGTNLREATLFLANLGGATLRRADLRDANSTSANLRRANLQGADLRATSFPFANLRSADLQGADLRGASLGFANLRGADMRGADLSGADLSGARLRRADLRGAKSDSSTRWPFRFHGPQRGVVNASDGS